MMLVLINMVLNVEHNSIDRYGWFSGILDIGWVEDQKMMKGRLINGKKCKQV